jgi:hypothetical protein
MLWEHSLCCKVQFICACHLNHLHNHYLLHTLLTSTNLAKSWSAGSQCNHQHIAVPKFKAKWYKVSHHCVLLITRYWLTSRIITYLLLFCCNLTSCKKEQELTLPVRVRRAQVGFSTSVLPQVPIGASLSEKEHRGSRSKSLGVGSNFER